MTLIRAFLLLWIFGPLSSAPVMAQNEPSQEQKDFISSMIIVGRVQAACVLTANGVLAPGIAKQFIEANLVSMPNGGGEKLKAEIQEKDPKCYGVFQ